MAKQFLFESTFLVIIDPTSATIKNVTPYCSQIFEIIEYFKRVYMALNSIKLECEKRLNIGLGAESMVFEEVTTEAIQKEMIGVTAEIDPSPNKLLSKLMNLIEINESNMTLEE